jgi:NADPH:quinone reductase-like Zn-dependent oxidoreductase
MRAAWFEKFGPAEDVLVVGDQPTPEPDDGELLVRLMTSGVNPSDVKKRAGSIPNLLDEGLVIPHSDGAGVVEKVGKGVVESHIGDRVWIYQAQYGRRLGTAAEYLAIDENRAAPLPENTGFDVGACLGIPAMTAHRCVFADGPVDGQTILITGGVGRVGHYAIQFATQAGARVIATACESQDRNDCIGAGAEVLKVIRTGGTIATYSSTQILEPALPFFQMLYMDLTIHFVLVYAMPEQAKQQAITYINDKLKNEQLQHRVAHKLPLSEIARAHELIEQGGFRGCVVLTLD